MKGRFVTRASMAGFSSKRTRRISALALTALLTSSLAAPPAGARSLDEGSREADLVEIRDRISEFERQLAELDDFGTGVEAELRRLTLDLSLQQQRVSEAVAERDLAEAGLGAARARLETVERELAETRRRLGARIRALDRSAPASWLRGFATVREPSDFFLYMRTLRTLARRDARLVPAYRAEQAELDAARRQLAERRDEVARSIARHERQLRKLEAAKRRQALVAKALERERLRLERETSTLDDKERKLSRLIAVLGSAGQAPLSGQPIQDFRGALDPPVEGEVSTPFGPVYEARYGTSVPHNGVRLTPSGSGEVRAVFPGAVIFAAPFEGFGLTVVLHHREQVFSLYAGLEELEVLKGDVVVLGQELGRAGSDLYFEMRVENRPEDPMEWLR